MKKAALHIFTAILVISSMFITSCGGSGGGSSSSGTPAASTTSVSGSVYAAPVAGASVVVKNAGGLTLAGPVNTAADGTYHINIPTTAISSDLRFESTGGTYSDEATGATTTAGSFAAYIAGGALTAGSAVHLDPGTTIVHELITNHTMTIGQAQTMFSSSFGFTPDTSVASSNMPSNGNNTPERLRAFRAGVFSELTKDMGYSPDKQADLIAAIVQDLGDDGKLNGSAGSVNGTALPEDIQNRYEEAIVSYLSNTTANLTALTTADIGNLPFAKIILTTSYRVEYIPGMMAPAVGKTQFKIKITKRSDNSAATGLTLSLMPLMHMPSMSHTAPADAVVEDAAHPGTYNCTVYYMMASGPGMGFWGLKVMIGGGMTGESATFYPAVGMGMGSDTAKFNLAGVSDYVVSGMTSTTKRTYMLFNDGLASGATDTLNLFIATTEDMMHMPAVSGGTVLTSPTGTWAVNPATTSVQASLDTTFSSPVIGTDNGGGHWSIPGISGLVTGTANTLYIKFTVNGEVKTSGTGAATANYATFIVTPGM